MTARLTPLPTVLTPPRDLVFMDCDGIIYDTNASKCDAFRFALEGWPAPTVEELVRAHRQSGGVSRYVKFERFFREAVSVPDVDAAVAEALARFGAFSEAAYGRLQPRPESLRFAAHFGGPERVHVVSGSDERELRAVFDQADLRPRFAGVHGSPVTKEAHLRRLLDDAGVPPSRALFIGDGGGDWTACAALGLPFIYLQEMSEWTDAVPTLSAASTEDGAPPIAIAPTWGDILEALPHA